VGTQGPWRSHCKAICDRGRIRHRHLRPLGGKKGRQRRKGKFKSKPARKVVFVAAEFEQDRGFAGPSSPKGLTPEISAASTCWWNAAAITDRGTIIDHVA